ncbi:MAG: hypothetical protein DME59_00770 [Verrucomicrobia bacterium]|nr:MAG: hypothetical protein DME59_00770 [Verrucomicrobiota bacterium]PYL78222.1 MAG: hypothetical protein DMF26_01350 [Verrucomicrobiota bacterium]
MIYGLQPAISNKTKSTDDDITLTKNLDGLDFTGDALFEIDRFRRKEHRGIKSLTVRAILDQQIAKR